MHIRLRHKSIVEGAIVVLALLVVALSTFLALRSYEHYRASALVAAASAVADKLAAAMEHYTLERGLTAAALGSRGREPERFRTPVLDARRKADATWQAAVALAVTLEAGGDFKAVLAQAEEAREQLETLRRRVDGYLDARADPPPFVEWFETVNRFLGLSARVWETVLFTEQVSQTELGVWAMPRKLLWEIADQAGQERALFAYYIAAGLSVPRGDLDRAQFVRDMAVFGIERVRRLLDALGTDARLAAAMARLHEQYVEGFEPLRAAVHRAAPSGRYPLDALSWIERASAAIGAIHAVNATITVITEERAQHSRNRQIGLLNLALVLFSGTLGLSFASLTRVRRMVDDVFQQKELAEITMNSIGDAVITTDVAARVEYLNPVAEELTGWSTAEAKGRPLAEVFRILNGYDRQPKEDPVSRCLRENRVVGLGNDTVLVRRDGSETMIEDSAAPVRDRHGEVVGAVMVFYEVAARRGNTHLLSYHYTHDRLTGLVNRAELERRLKGVLEEVRTRGGEHALIYLDLDQFKVVNDTCGHAAGDQLLRQLTRHLQQRVRDNDTFARFGSDEFVLLLARCPLAQAVDVAEDLLRRVRAFRFEWQGRLFQLGASVGIVPISAEETSAGEILAKADAACAAAKEKGRHRVQVYEPGNLDLARRHGEMHWVSRLTWALEQDRLRLYCQPIVPLAGKGPTHYEILVRLLDENDRLVLPGEFIPAAERYGLMPQIDRWVVRHTLETLEQALAKGRASHAPAVVCNINLSGASLNEAAFLDVLRAELESAAAVPPRAVCFEITETAAVANLEQASRLIRTLKGLGSCFALDDFGTGLCSFAYLREMQVDFLKIGGQFVKEIARDRSAYAAVRAINTLGHTLRLRTVAEHVSSPKILQRVREVGVDYAQGFAIARPMPVEKCMLTHFVPTRASTAQRRRRPR